MSEKWEEEYDKLHESFLENASAYTLQDRIYAMCWIIVKLLLKILYKNE